jgi:hypothetical protein
MLNKPARMTAINILSNLHQWLHTTPSSARAIVLHGGSPVFSECLIEEVCEYLNEYDDDGAGHWLAGTPELVHQIATSPELRSLLGITAGCPNCPPTSPCGVRKTLLALASRGHVIVRAPQSAGNDSTIPNAFHAGIGVAAEIGKKCHLILNPELMDPKCFPHIIGDLFLEWLHRELIPAETGGEIR